MPPQATGPDVRQLAQETLSRAEFPGGRQQSFRVFFAPEAHQQIWQHSKADTTVEICGVLVGQWGQDDGGPFVAVSASIRGQAAANKFAEVTFTHQTWSEINAEMDSKYADRAIVGWYHTHPDFGIFLSDRDRFIQENFFSAPGQIALVVDPIRKTEGAFVWRDGKPSLASYFWVGDDVRPAPDAAASQSTSADNKPPVEPIQQPLIPVAVVRGVEKSLPYILVFLVGLLLAGRLRDAALRRAALEGSAYSLYQLGLRPGLELRIAELRSEVKQLTNISQGLATEHQALLGHEQAKAEEVEKAQDGWKAVAALLANADAVLDVTEQTYCLTSEQRDLLERLLAARSSGRPGAPFSGVDERTPSKSSVPAKPPASENATDKKTDKKSE
jgi:proteasome lid subunit RPN8/RPN11